MLARYERWIVDEDGNVVNGATVKVTNESTGALPTLYSDVDGLVAVGNPYTLGSETGKMAFHCLGGFYRVDVTAGAFSDTFRWQPIGTAQGFDQEQILQGNKVQVRAATT